MGQGWDSRLGRHQLQPGGVADLAAGPHDRHAAVLQRLRQCIEHVPVELGEFVQEQDPSMPWRTAMYPDGRSDKSACERSRKRIVRS